jgi:hypothetical protein
MRKNREEWEQDLSARQQNVVFPDTVRNEGNLWRNLMSGKQKLTLVQCVGVALMYLALIAILWGYAAIKFRSGTSGPLLERLLATASDFVIPLGLLGVFFLVLRWRVRRALLSGKPADRPR